MCSEAPWQTIQALLNLEKARAQNERKILSAVKSV
jgi:hypothetical protein